MRRQIRNRQLPMPDTFGELAMRPRELLSGLRKESFAFWMLCAYLIVEYVRPQSIFPAIDILPLGKIVLPLALLGMLFDSRRHNLVSDPANILLTAFLLALVVSSIFATYPEYSLDHWFDFVGWYVIYFLIINIVITQRRFVVFLLLFLLASFKLSFFGARTWTFRGFSFTDWGIMGPPGPFQNSGELSVQMLMFAPVAYQLALYMRPRVKRRTFVALMFVPITAAMTVIGASSRGAQLALGYQSYRSLLKGRLTVRGVLVAITAIALTAALFPVEQLERFRSSGSDVTSLQRLLYWKRGIEMISDNPVLGVGYYNFAPYFAAHFPQDMLIGIAQLPHNIFIQVGTDAGFLGLAIFVALLIRNFQCCRRVQTLTADAADTCFAAGIAKGLGIALWGFILAGQFVTITYYPFFWINLAMSVALMKIVEGHRTAKMVKSP